MDETLTPKFSVGDKVKEKGLPNSEGGKVTNVLYSSDTGFRYVFESIEVNMATKKLIDGQKVCLEKELELFNEPKNESK